MGDVFATSFGVLNYSGMLFNKGNTKTPLSSIIGNRMLQSNHSEFAVGQYYTAPTAASVAQPAISETASLTAPDATVVTRTQVTNVVQIFQRSVGISYVKEANMGTLSGLNVAGQLANPINELDFQVARKMEEIRADIEYTFIQGAYNKATSDATVNKSRGLTTAITTNVTAMSSAPLGYWNVVEMMQKIYNQNAPTTDLCLWLDAVTMLQLTSDASVNGMTIVPADRTVNGIALDSLVTPFGKVYIKLGEYLPSGTALILNLGVLAPVIMPVPGKGNFFLEPLAKTGAGQKYQIFGMIGLDHGMEWCHGKWTGLSTTATAPQGRKVFIANASDFPSIETE